MPPDIQLIMTSSFANLLSESYLHVVANPEKLIDREN